MAGGSKPARGEDRPAFSRRRAGFAPAARYLAANLGKAAARRGLTETRLITDWMEIVGPVAGAVCAPVGITRRGRALGGTLELRGTPGRGPEIEMMAPQIVERVNACFGYRAVARIRLVQEAHAGFAEQVAGFDFAGAPEVDAGQEAQAATKSRIEETVSEVADPDLRHSLERLGLAIARRAAGRQAKEPKR
ncbi:MAG: DUF721 domain-containing protein [Pseudomonadota bacterium]